MIIMLRYSRAPPCAKRVSGSMATYYDRAHKVDNLKSAVLRRIVGQAPVLNPKYIDFSRHYGFDITACNVRKGNEKGYC